jgi:hypothetical protein
MTRAELLDRAGIAERWGVAIKTVDKIRERAGAAVQAWIDAGQIGPAPLAFPVAAKVYGRTPLWRASDIDKFDRARRAAARGNGQRRAS